ncbi:MAG TPA: hypothetical protein VGX71_23860 [Pseudaminobacter sp.]|nr:hypothetical protein [Pseudaminobacter sp.]
MIKRTWFRPAVRIVWKRGVRHVDSLQVTAEILMSKDWPTYGPKLEEAALALGQASGAMLRWTRRGMLSGKRPRKPGSSFADGRWSGCREGYDETVGPA